MSTTRKCQICGSPSDGSHFGSEACKACAAFFRRSVVNKKKYSCRGKGNCTIRENRNFKCRFCRFNMCYAAGMNKQQVQNRTDDYNSDTAEEEELEPVASTSTSANNSPVVFPPEEVKLKKSEKNENNEKLGHIVEEYRSFIKISLNFERALVYNEMLTTGTNFIEPDFFPTNFNLTTKILRGYVSALPDFVNRAFPPFVELKQEDKLLLLKDFVPRLVIWEQLYRTANKTTKAKKRFMMTRLTYVDLLNFTHVYDNCEVPFDTTEVARILQLNLLKADNVIEHLRKLEVTEIENAFIIGMLMWNPSPQLVHEKLHSICKEERSQLFRAISSHYEVTQSMEDFSVRIGELTCLLSPVEYKSAGVRTDMEVMKLFDAFGTDSFLCDLLAPE